MSKDAYYFSHDSNARNDDKVIALRMKYGWEGYGLFWAIIERLRESSDYMSVCDYNIIAYDLRVDSAKIKSIINDFGLFAFTDDGKCFYSERLKNNMETKSNVARENALKRWNNNQNMQSQCNGISTAMQKDAIKVKESKVKKIEERKKDFYLSLQEFLSIYPKEMLRLFYDYWTEKNKSGTKMKFELQETFEISKRLATWASRDKNFIKNETPKEEIKSFKLQTLNGNG